MKKKRLSRVDPGEGYDLWAETYDQTLNPLVSLDRRHTLDLLKPEPGDVVLDAACGTGQNLRRLVRSGSRATGLDLSCGMLRVARRSVPEAPLVRANLQRPLPLRDRTFDSVLCALVGEHLHRLSVFFREAFTVLRPGGRLVFSVFHPEMASAGIEANFEKAGVEYRLGAERHTVDDYVNVAAESGFRRLSLHEFSADRQLAREVPTATKYVGRPLLLVLEGTREN